MTPLQMQQIARELQQANARLIALRRRVLSQLTKEEDAELRHFRDTLRIQAQALIGTAFAEAAAKALGAAGDLRQQTAEINAFLDTVNNVRTGIQVAAALAGVALALAAGNPALLAPAVGALPALLDLPTN